MLILQDVYFLLAILPVADPGEGPGRACPPPLFLDQTEARRGEKNCFGDQTRPPYLWVLMTGPALSEGLDLSLIATSYIKTLTIK